MSNLRFTSLQEALKHEPISVGNIPNSVSEYFGANVFNEKAMQEFLPVNICSIIAENIERSQRIDIQIADQVASGMRSWATSKGATHYSHWFLPLNGATAEKHDSFFSPSFGGKKLEQFSGNNLVQQEPDASSFPSGGLRNTFEARGYSAWDPSSPAFILDNTLCIPTIFVSYTGHALDFKTPLIKSTSFLDGIATEICQLFDRSINKVYSTLGWEQEYFLIDESLYFARPDLIMTGRTLTGHSPAKGQQLDDHYFGSIPPRVKEFMKDFEYEAWKLGIPVKTRHNEVAPNQFELAPVYEEANIAIDHNQLIMDIMGKIARKHKFRVLFHEKPFAGVNGSGKHNNWSLSTNTGKNLLSPGHTPKTNLLFLTFFINFIKAVNDNADLLRAAIASAGNDHRLGANEAPPAIISIFIGTQLTNILDEIEQKVKNRKMTPDEKTDIKLNIGKIPKIIIDNTDRNRTSPLAFTGNKFEFRAVGSAANCGPTVIAFNTILANQLKIFKNDLDIEMSKDTDKDEAILKILRKYISGSKNILFEGNGYSKEWAVEAKKRGLSNFKNTPSALKAYIYPQTIELFEKNNILSSTELHARWEIKHENYSKVLQIESRVLADISGNHIIPTAIKYQNIILENIKGLKQVLSDDEFESQAEGQLYLLGKISGHITEIRKFVKEMIEKRKNANSIENAEEKSIYYCQEIKPFLDKIRYHTDKLELLIDDEIWPLPKYREMLFVK